MNKFAPLVAVRRPHPRVRNIRQPQPRAPKVAADRDALALDRAGSVRSYDEDDRLHVASANLTRAMVNQYPGREIVEYERHGLDPDRLYRLLRCPSEIAKAVRTFDRLPILTRHAPANADDHMPGIVAGSTGSEAAFDGLHLTNSLVIWAADALAGIEGGQVQQLSAAYRYAYEPNPGTYKGQEYDGIMRNIRGSHVALVERGRAGNTVIIEDSAMPVVNENDPDFGNTDPDVSGLAKAWLYYWGNQSLSEDQMAAIKLMVNGAAPPDADAETANDSRRKLRPMTAAQDRAFTARFPGASRLKNSFTGASDFMGSE